MWYYRNRMVSGVARILLQGARARGARVPKFVATKSSRSESHLALGLQNLRAFTNSRRHVPQCPMTDDATAYDVVFTWPKTEFIYFTDFNVKFRKFSTSDTPDPIWVAASNGAYPRTLPQNPHSAMKPTTPPLSACRHFCRNLRVDTAVVICSLMQLRI